MVNSVIIRHPGMNKQDQVIFMESDFIHESAIHHSLWAWLIKLTGGMEITSKDQIVMKAKSSGVDETKMPLRFSCR